MPEQEWAVIAELESHLDQLDGDTAIVSSDQLKQLIRSWRIIHEDRRALFNGLSSLQRYDYREYISEPPHADRH